jgi:aspartate aminotransferase-like enzyme
MVPPGLAMVSVSEKAWRAHAQAKMPRYYWDFTKAKNFLQKGQTPWTPAISVFFALDVSLDLMLSEGLDKIFARHARVAQMARNGAKSLGLSLFPDEKYASNTVTAVNAAEKIDVSKLTQLLREEYKVILAGGQEKLSGKIFRIGHLGLVYEEDIKSVLEALSKALPRAKKG